MDEEVVNLTPEEVQEVLDWASRTSTYLCILQNMAFEDEPTADDIAEALSAYIEVCGVMTVHIPACIAELSWASALDFAHKMNEENQLIEQFREEMKEL